MRGGLFLFGFFTAGAGSARGMKKAVVFKGLRFFSGAVKR